MNIRQYIPHYRILLSLGLPIVVGQLGTIVLGFADTLMVGHHDVMELAAAGFVNNIMTMVLILALGFSYGLTPIIGNLHGRGDTRPVGSVMLSALVAATVVAAVLVGALWVLLACIGSMGQPQELLPLMRPYLVVNMVSVPFVCWFNTYKQFFDAVAHTRTPMFIILSGNVLNILGNWLLIYGVGPFPELGLQGAGLSTLLSRVVMAAAAVVIYGSREGYAPYRDTFGWRHVSSSMLRRITAMSLPVSLQMGMETAAFSLTAVMVGWIGAMALATHQIMLTVAQLFYMVYYGLSAAVAIRVSYYGGQQQRLEQRRVAYAGFHIVMLVAVMFSVPVFLMRHSIGGWFTDSAEVSAMVARVIVVLILYQLGDGLQCTFANALRGTGNVRPAMYVAFVSYFVVSLPLSWFCGVQLEGGLLGIWTAFPVSLTLAGLLYHHFFRRETRRPE